MRSKKITVLLGSAVVCLIALSAFGQDSVDCTVWVEVGASIQDAIDQAPEGATICLPDGEWQENLTINKSLILRGSGAELASISGKIRGIPVVRIDSPEPIIVVVEDLTIRNAQGSTQECASVYPQQEQTICADGIAVMGYAKVTLERVYVADNGRMGVYATDYSQITLHNCTITGSGRIGLFVRRYATGEAENCSIFLNNEGANVSDSAALVMTSSQIIDSSSYGLYAGGQPTCSLVGCLISGNGNNGIALAHQPHLELVETIVTANNSWGIVKLSYPFPYDGTLLVDDETNLTGNQLGAIGTL